jgi:hypothetical protein
MKDPKGGLSSTGGYPWFIKESSSTVVFIKNVTDEPQQFMLSIVYPGGQWGSKIRTIEPGQTFALDVRKLRDSQEKGSDGNVIPLDATSGHVSWSYRGKRDKVLIGRAQTVDFNNGLASTYECQCPCGWSYLEGRMIPNYVTAFPGDVITYLAQSHQVDCAGNDRGWWDINPMFFFSSSSSNPGVADWTGNGTATAFAPGLATLGVTWIDNVERLEITVDEHEETHMECIHEDVLADSSANCAVDNPPDITITRVEFVPAGVNPGGSFNVRVTVSASTNCPTTTKVKIGLQEASNPNMVGYTLTNNELEVDVSSGGSATKDFPVTVSQTSPNGRVQFRARLVSSVPSQVQIGGKAVNIELKPGDGVTTNPGICIGVCS